MGNQEVPVQDMRPKIVKRWEGIFQRADSADVATSRLVYEMLVQIRTIKLILAWVLLFIPAAAAAVLIVTAVLANADTSPSNPYGY